MVKLLIDLYKPTLYSLKRFSVGNVKYDHDSMCTPVIVASNGLELFLTSCVPLSYVSLRSAV